MSIFQISDKAAWEKAVDNIRSNEVPSDAPQIPDPSLAIGDNLGKCKPVAYQIKLSHID